MKAPVATVGAALPSNDAEGFTIKNGNLRGVDSNGMLCGASEIDLTDSIDGLLELPSDAPIGMDIREYLGLDNQILISLSPQIAVIASALYASRARYQSLTICQCSSLRFLPTPTDANGTKNTTPAVTVSVVEACPRHLLQSISNIDRSIDTPKWMTDALVQSDCARITFWLT